MLAIKLHHSNDKLLHVIELLFKNGVNPNTPNKNFNTALILALKVLNNKNIKNIKHVIELLLKNGANPNAQNVRGITALMYAIPYVINRSYGTDEMEIVKILLKYGADPNIFDGYNTPLKNVVKDFHSMECLHLAELLLMHGANPHSVYEEIKSDSDIFCGTTDFEFVLKWQNMPYRTQIIQKFIEYTQPGYSVDKWLFMLINSYNPDDFVDILEMLLKQGCDPNYIVPAGISFLRYIISKINNVQLMTEALQLLLNYGVHVNKLEIPHSRSILTDMVHKYRHIPGGETVIELLLKHGAKSIYSYGYSAMEYACHIDEYIKSEIPIILSQIDKSIINMLLEHKITDNHDSVLQLMCSYKKSRDLEVIKIIKLLLLHDNNIKNCFDNCWSSICHDPELIKLFLDYGLNITGYLHLFIDKGFEKYVQLYFYIKYCKTLIGKELTKYINEFHYNEKSIRVRINMLRLNLTYKNYSMNELQETYGDIINYLGVVDMEHLKEKIDFFIV